MGATRFEGLADFIYNYDTMFWDLCSLYSKNGVISILEFGFIWGGKKIDYFLFFSLMWCHTYVNTPHLKWINFTVEIKYCKLKVYLVSCHLKFKWCDTTIYIINKTVIVK